MTILTTHEPTEYTIYTILNNTEKFRNFIKGLCNIDIISSGISPLLAYINNNPKGWTIRTSDILKSLLQKNFSDLPSWVITNLSSSKYRAVKTLNGYPFDIAKSAIQKYTRRAIPHKAQYMANDMYIMNWATPDSKASMTNFYNRIRIIYLEDIGLGSPPLLYLVHNTLKDIKDNPTLLSIKLPWLFRCMSFTTKSRVYSHIRAFYKNPQNIPSTPPLPKVKYILPSKEGSELQVVVDAFVWCMENRNVRVYFWLDKIMEIQKLQTKYFNSTRPGFLVFDIILKNGFIADRKSIDICMEWYKDMKMMEQTFPVIHCVFLYVLQDKAVWDAPLPHSTLERYLSTYKPNLLNETISLDNYVFDKHTAKGRTMGRTNTDFALEGSIVSYDIGLYPDLANQYMLGHISRGIPSSETKEFTNAQRAQLNTGASKQDVYFATDRRGKNVVVKGPYPNIEKLSMTFKFQNIMKLFPEVNYYDVNVMILKPDMFTNIPLGLRNAMVDKPYTFFMVMEDIMNQDVYPMTVKSSKVWKDEPIVDYNKLFSDNPNMGFATPQKGMSDEAIYSLAIQLAFRKAFKIGDISQRNFIRIGDKVYNVDTEGIMVSDYIKWSESDTKVINRVIKKYKTRYVNTLRQWLTQGEEMELYISRWIIVEKTLTHDPLITETIRQSISELIDIANI